MLGDGAAQRSEMLPADGVRRLVAATIEQCGRADEIGEQDRREVLLHVQPIIPAPPGRVIPEGEVRYATHPEE